MASTYSIYIRSYVQDAVYVIMYTVGQSLCYFLYHQVVINQDKMSQQLSAFRSRIQELELELQEFKSGRKVVSDDGSVVINDMAYEITMLRTENDKCVCFAAKFRITACISDWVVVLSFWYGSCFVHQTLARVLHC